jgi:hypothetical protein
MANFSLKMALKTFQIFERYVLKLCPKLRQKSTQAKKKERNK